MTLCDLFDLSLVQRRVAPALETGAAASGVARFRPRAVQSWGECLTEERRERLETALGAPVFNLYKTHEFGELAQDCRERSGLHVTMERALVEFVHGDRAVPDGVDGEILVTPLDNLAMPLFRYRVGDVGCRIPGSQACGCGRTSERILLTDGRASSLVTSPSGERVHPDWFEWLFENVPGVLDWRVTQPAAQDLRLTIVPGVAWRADAEPWLRQTLAELDDGFRVALTTAETLPVRPDGRRERVHSSVPLRWKAGAA
jgi:phenylacetate-CoA ligase